MHVKGLPVTPLSLSFSQLCIDNSVFMMEGWQKIHFLRHKKALPPPPPILSNDHFMEFSALQIDFFHHKNFPKEIKFSYRVTVSLGNGLGMLVNPRSEQSTTTPEFEQEHSAGHAPPKAGLNSATSTKQHQSKKNTLLIILTYFFGWKHTDSLSLFSPKSNTKLRSVFLFCASERCVFPSMLYERSNAPHRLFKEAYSILYWMMNKKSTTAAEIWTVLWHKFRPKNKIFLYTFKIHQLKMIFWKYEAEKFRIPKILQNKLNNLKF